MTPVQRICNYCTAHFYIDSYEVARGHGVYCSTRCCSQSPETRERTRRQFAGVPKSPEHVRKVADAKRGVPSPHTAARNRLLRGPLSPSWKGGISSLMARLRRSGEYQAFRREVLLRDGYLCVLCGHPTVTVDHIKPFALFPELRTNPDNGRALCTPCHLKTPTFGNRVYQEAHA